MTTRYFMAFAKNPHHHGGTVPHELDPKLCAWQLTELFVPKEEYPRAVGGGFERALMWWPPTENTHIRFSTHVNQAEMNRALVDSEVQRFTGMYAYLNAQSHAAGWEVSERGELLEVEAWLERTEFQVKDIPPNLMPEDYCWPTTYGNAFAWKVIFSVEEDFFGRWEDPTMVASMGTQAGRSNYVPDPFENFDGHWENMKTAMVTYAKYHVALREEWQNPDNCITCSAYGNESDDRELRVVFVSTRRGGTDRAVNYHPLPLCSYHAYYTGDQEVYSCTGCGLATAVVLGQEILWHGASRVTPRWAASNPGGHLVFAMDNTYFLCEECYLNHALCDDCDQIYNLDEDCDCGRDDYEPSHWVQSWDYRPEFTYYPLVPTRKDGLYLGMEVEVSFARYDQWPDLSRYVTQKMPPLWYVKSDSSVENGYEWVTNPFEPDWIFENWDEQVVSVMETLRLHSAHENHRSTGLHVHMSKDAFTPSHLYRFIQFHKNLKDMCGLMGGRGSESNWGSFAELERSDFNRALKTIVKHKYFDDQNRYSAINLLPEDTVELRYGAGTTNPERIRTYLEWVMSVFEFTKSVKAYQATGALKEPGNFLWWVYEHEDRYPGVADRFRQIYPTPTPMVTR